MINPSLKDLNLPLEELKEIVKLFAKKRGIKSYESMSEDVMSCLKACALMLSKPVIKSEKNFDDTKPKINFSKVKIEKIRKKFNESRHKFSKSKINLYKIKNKKNLFALRVEEIEKNLLEIEKNLFKTKKYYDYDNNEYKGIRDVKNLFDFSIDEDYYKPVITNGAFNNNYIQYESKANKDKILTTSEYLGMIRPYLSDIINDHKTQGEWRIHSGNTIIKHKTQSEWKIQLTMAINHFSSNPDSDKLPRDNAYKK